MQVVSSVVHFDCGHRGSCFTYLDTQIVHREALGAVGTVLEEEKIPVELPTAIIHMKHGGSTEYMPYASLISSRKSFVLRRGIQEVEGNISEGGVKVLVVYFTYSLWIVIIHVSSSEFNEGDESERFELISECGTFFYE